MDKALSTSACNATLRTAPFHPARSEVASLVLAAGGLFILSLLWLLLSNVNHDLAREHGPMENLQSAFLFAAFLVLFRHTASEKNLGTRILFAAMAAGYFTFLALEFDVRPLESKWLTLIFNGPIRNAWMLIAWAIIGVFAFRNLHQVLAAFHVWRRTSSAVLLASSAVFWAAGAVAEKWFSKLNPSPYFIEEFMENHATWLMLLAAISLKTSQPVYSTIQWLRAKLFRVQPVPAKLPT